MRGLAVPVAVSLALALLLRSDVLALCCPPACAVAERYDAQRANVTLKACAESLGEKRWTWSVGMACGCGK